MLSRLSSFSMCVRETERDCVCLCVRVCVLPAAQISLTLLLNMWHMRGISSASSLPVAAN